MEIRRAWTWLYVAQRRRKRRSDPAAPPAAPTNLQGTDISGAYELTWDMTGVHGELGISIEERDLDEGDAFHEVGTVGPGASVYDSSGPVGSNLQCRVRAFNSAGYSAYSNTVTINLI